MIQQDTQDWLDFRKSRIGASDSPVIMGVSPYMTPYQLYQVKNNLVEQKTNANMEFGKRREDVVRKELQEQNFCSLEPLVLVHSKFDWFMCSLDAINEEMGLVFEIKNGNAKDHELVRKGEVPSQFWPQLQHQAEIVFDKYGIDVIHLAHCNQDDIIVLPVKRDHDYVQTLIEKDFEFYEKCVVNKTAPPLCKRDYAPFPSNIELFEKLERLKELSKKLDELKFYKKEYDAIRLSLHKYTGGENAEGHGVRLTKSITKGSIDYEKIPQLQGVDLDQYRKDSFVKWRVDFN